MYRSTSALPLQFKSAAIHSLVASITLIAFIVSSLVSPINAFSQENLVLPPVGKMLNLSQPFTPMMIKGIKIHKDNPFEFDFIINPGQENLPEDQFQNESLKLVKYFLASLAIPENDLWVNLSPYEKNRITTPELGVTEMGRDLLSQDYVLKQLTSSLIYPEGKTGKKFWSKVYALAEERFHTTNVPINTFNKVWIVPQKAVVYENYNNQTAYVLESKLKVLLEEDYLSLKKHTGIHIETPQKDVNTLGSQIVREIVIPELTKEVNYGKNFANLRQITNSLILAAWFKRALKASILAKLYVDQKKIKGVDLEDRTVAQRIFQQYLRAYKKGVYNYIKEEADPVSGEIIPRKYFSGGYFGKLTEGENLFIKNYATPAQVSEKNDRAVTVDFNNAMVSAELSPERKKEIISSAFFPLGDAMLRVLRLLPAKPLTPVQKKKFVEAVIPAVKQAYLNSKEEINKAEDLLPRPKVPAMYQRNEVFRYSGPEGVVVVLDHIFKKGTRLHGHSPSGRITVSSFGEFPDAVRIYEFLKNNGLLEIVPESERVSDEEEGIPYQLGSKDEFALSLFIGLNNNKYKRILRIIQNAHEEASSGVLVIPRADGFIEEKYPDHIYQGQRELNLDPNTSVKIPLTKEGVYGFTDYEYGVHKVLYSPVSNGPEYAGMIEVYYFPKPVQGFNSFFPVLGSKDNQYKSIPRFRAERMVYPNFIDIAAHEHWQEISKEDARGILSDTRSQHYFIRVINGEDYFVPDPEVREELEGSVSVWVAQTDSRFVLIKRNEAMTSTRLATVNELLDPKRTLITADGITRDGAYTFEQADLPKEAVDVVIIGAGASGLATGIQAVDNKLSTVILESGYVGQSFSDAFMNFWRMRTPAFKFWLLQKGFNSLTSLSELDFTNKLPGFRKLALEAAELIKEKLGKDFLIARPDGAEQLNNGTVPLARAEVFQHFLDVANAIVRRGGLILENDPVKSVIKIGDGHFEVITENGIKVVTKNVVYATGLGNEKTAEILEKIAHSKPEQYTLVSTPQQIPENGLIVGSKIPILNSQVLNDPRFVKFVRHLPQGSSVGVVGGGQSAGNSVAFIHSIRPDIVVHVFTKNKLTVHGSQMPGGFRHAHLMWEYVTNEDLRQESWSKGGPQVVETPMTPPIFKHINETVGSGTTKVHVLGKFFDDSNFDIRTEGKTASIIDKQDGETVAAINNGGFISAVGFTARSPQRDALYANAAENKLIDINDKGIIKVDQSNGLTSTLDPHIYIAGVQLLSQGAVTDGSTQGTVVRARAIIERIIKGRTPRLSDEQRINTVREDYSHFLQTLNDVQGAEKETVAAFLTLAKSKPGESLESIKEKYERALKSNAPLEAARFTAEVAGQTGKDIVDGGHYSIPVLTAEEVKKRIFATDMPGYLAQQDGKNKISHLFDEVIQDKADGGLSAAEQLLYPVTEYGVGREKAFKLYDELRSSHVPEVAAILTRAATTYLPFSDTIQHDRAQTIEDPGGIDLAMSNTDFEIKRDIQGIPLPVQFQNLENIHINGLTARIVKDTVIINLPEFLGVSVL